MTSQLISIVSIFYFLSFTACKENNFIEYSSKEYTISYCETWDIKIKNNAVLFLSPKESETDVFQENIGIIIQDLSINPMTLEEYTELTRKQVIENLGESSISLLKEVSLANENAKLFVYDMDYQGKKLKIRQYWFIKNNKAYLFT